MLQSSVKAFLVGVAMVVVGYAIEVYYANLFASYAAAPIPYRILSPVDVTVAILGLALMSLGGAIVLGSVIHWVRESIRGGPYEKVARGDGYAGD
jgi:hypothetical protein